MVIPAVIGGAGSLVAGGLNYIGQREANEMNRKISERQMKFQQTSTREQMGFQERMSNTAYQRAVADLNAAGLNPVLAYSQGGASTPGGASGSGASARMENKFAGAVSSAVQMRQVMANVEQTKMMTQIMQAELAGKQLEAEIYKGPMGRILKYMQLFSQPVNAAMNLVNKVKGG